MSMNQGYSQLFQSLSSSSGNFLADYASIKSGSYAKLMKAYYGTGHTASAGSASAKSDSRNTLDKILEEKKNPTVSKEVQEANSQLTEGIPKLKSAVSALQDEKTYTNTENGQSATDKVVSAMKTYVSEYNNVVTAAKRSTLASKTAYIANIMQSTSANADKLAEMGVTINANGTLQLNEGKLKTADLSQVQDLFSNNDIMSYGSKVTSRLEFAGTAPGSTNKTDSTDSTDSADTDKTTSSGASSLKTDSATLASDKLYEMIKDKDGKNTYDVSKILSTAKSFVKNDNRMLDSAESSVNSGVLSNLSQIKQKTAQNAFALKQFGIDVDGKGRMTLDEDKFQTSDMSKVQKFFKNYGSSIATNASLVDYYMTTNANAANFYTAAGAYNVQGSSLFADAF